jgi:intracellular septation protein
MALSKAHQLRSFLVGGVVPIVLYTVIEEYFGTWWGLIAGMAFGLGEMMWEWRTQGRVDPMTWGGNGMLLILGGVSLFTQEGIWFKLQPALIEGILVLVLWASVCTGKPILLTLAQKQRVFPQRLEDQFPPLVAQLVRQSLQGMTFRLGVFFAIHALLSVWAALYWSTAAWAALKGIGLTVSLILYWVVESLVLRYRISFIPK